MKLEKSKNEFLKYVEKYDLKDKNIILKQKHSLRVMEISKEIAEKLELEKEEIELATLIGLLHDIARFEQYTQYHTFHDVKSIDHGDFGVKILEKDIRKYIEVDRYDGIIKKAIKNHNKYQIQDGLTEKEMLFTKIIRDADKIDIFYEAVEMFWSGKEEDINNAKIAKEIEEQFLDYEQIKRKPNSKSIENVDEVISIIAFIFDINFKSSFEILYKNDYINRILDRFEFKDKETKEKMNEIRKIANEYIIEKGR